MDASEEEHRDSEQVGRLRLAVAQARTRDRSRLHFPSFISTFSFRKRTHRTGKIRVAWQRKTICLLFRSSFFSETFAYFLRYVLYTYGFRLDLIIVNLIKLALCYIFVAVRDQILARDQDTCALNRNAVI